MGSIIGLEKLLRSTIDKKLADSPEQKDWMKKQLELTDKYFSDKA